jgi:predicted nucleic-acid-binding Zn-ribbon protein
MHGIAYTVRLVAAVATGSGYSEGHEASYARRRSGAARPFARAASCKRYVAPCRRVSQRGCSRLYRPHRCRGTTQIGARHGGCRMPHAIAPRTYVAVRCMSCRHRSTLDALALERFGLKTDTPIAAFVKRLRCSKCGSGNVIAQRVRATETNRRRA